MNTTLQTPIERGDSDTLSVPVPTDGDDGEGVVVNVDVLPEKEWKIEDGVDYESYYRSLFY